MNWARGWIGLWLVIAAVLVTGCGASHGVAYQNSTIDALLDGNYDGEVTFAELQKHGDFGIGTFNALDGEMIALDGWFYQVKSDGRTHPVSPYMHTPFSVVTRFKGRKSAHFEVPLTYQQLKGQLDALRPVDGHAYAFAVEGWFEIMRTRSVARQNPPYPRLVDAVQDQKTFERKNVRGTLVGFWFPESLRHVNVPGYHFHFLSEGHSIGGHVLDLKMRQGDVRVQQISTIEIALPSTPATTRPGGDHYEELNRVEK